MIDDRAMEALARIRAWNSVPGLFAGQIELGPDFDKSLWAAELTDAPPPGGPAGSKP